MTATTFYPATTVGKRMFQATVIKDSVGALYVEITRADDRSDKPSVIASIPCATMMQAWAVADAYNHPEHASNDWRDSVIA
jgi:ribosomal protein L1